MTFTIDVYGYGGEYGATIFTGTGDKKKDLAEVRRIGREIEESCDPSSMQDQIYGFDGYAIKVTDEDCNTVYEADGNITLPEDSKCELAENQYIIKYSGTEKGTWVNDSDIDLDDDVVNDYVDQFLKSNQDKGRADALRAFFAEKIKFDIETIDGFTAVAAGVEIAGENVGLDQDTTGKSNSIVCEDWTGDEIDLYDEEED